MFKTVSSPFDYQAFVRSVVASIGLLVSMAHGAVPQLVADVNKTPDSVGTFPMDMVAVGERVFFTADDRTRGRELWVSDGTPGGTRLVNDLRVGQTGSMPSRLAGVDQRVFFFADDGEHGTELWSSDGDGATMAGDNGFGGASSSPKQVVAAGGLLYFAMGPISGPSGWGLWRSDGTAEGTLLLNPSSDIFTRPFGFSRLLTEMGGVLFFTNFERELWRSTGTAEQTMMLSDVGADAKIVSMAAAFNQLWLTVDRGADKELWLCDGTTAQIVRVLPGGAFSSGQLLAVPGRAYFAAGDPLSGIELWTSDGTTTQRVTDINEGDGSSVPSGLNCG